MPPSRPPIAPVMLPAWVASCPVARNVPVSGAVTASASGRPATASGPRATVQPISAFFSNCEIGLSRLPSRFFGAACSMASRMAVSAIAAGVTMTEERLTGLSGGTCTSTGRFSSRLGENRFITRIAPANEPATTTAPRTIFPTGRAMRPTPLNCCDIR